MIEFKQIEEREISLFYAKKMNNGLVVSILEKGEVANSEQATALAKFYWSMVSESVKEKDAGIDHGFGNLDMWLEYICNSLFFYLSNNGYEYEWESQ